MKKCFVLLILSISFWSLFAAVPGKIPVQGTLMDKDGNLISDDAAQIIFIIYDAETEGNELWREERTLFVEKGKLAVYLGEIEPVTVEKIGGQEELWLSVTYDGEEMSRIQLGSVPYALEAQTAHNAEAVGKYTETTLDDYFSATCAEGSYLRGWSGTSPICETDEGGENGGTTYTAGTGIIIDGDVISVDQTIDLYVAGTGIDIDVGTNTISVNPSVFATTDHNHDSRYYLKSEVYSKSETYAKSDVYTKTEIDSNVYKKSDVYSKTESDGRYYTKTQSDGRYHLKSGDMVISGSENNGSSAALKVISNGTQTILIDGNEIDSNDKLYLNNNSGNDIRIGGMVTSINGRETQDIATPGGLDQGSWQSPTYTECPDNYYVCGLAVRTDSVGCFGSVGGCGVTDVSIKCCSIGK